MQHGLESSSTQTRILDTGASTHIAGDISKFRSHDLIDRNTSAVEHKDDLKGLNIQHQLYSEIINRRHVQHKIQTGKKEDISSCFIYASLSSHSPVRSTSHIQNSILSDKTNEQIKYR